MKDYRIRAQKFIDSILPYITDCITSPSKVAAAIEDYNHSHSRKVVVSYGATRIALITSDYVIKWDYDEEEIEQFGGCDSEYETYLFAKSEGYAYLLAEVTQVEIHGFTFNIMPRVHYTSYTTAARKGSLYHRLSLNEYGWINENLADIHYCNWGLLNGKVCIFDYAARVE